MLSGNQLKMIATICMITDHVTKIFYIRMINPILAMDWMTPEFHRWIRGTYMVLILIGGVAFPVFAFLVSEGYFHTHDKKRFLLRMAIFALISEIPFDITFNYAGGPDGWDQEIAKHWPMWWGYQNIFFTYLTSLGTLWVLDQTKRIKKAPLANLLQGIIVLGAFLLNEEIIQGDYGGYGLLLIITAYILRNNRLFQIVGMITVNLLLYKNFSTIIDWLRLSFAVAMLLILFYNGKRGKKNLKLFFYNFYPAHIVVIGLLDWMIFTVFGVFS